MRRWQRETFEIINDGHFRVIDPGPLHAPVRTFRIRRDDKLDLLLETRASPEAKSNAAKYPSGTVRLNSDIVELENLAGLKAILRGVIPTQVRTFTNFQTDQSELTEEARIHELDAVLRSDVKSAYTIDWVENFPNSSFIWPDSIKATIDTNETVTIGLSEDGITTVDFESQQSMMQMAVKIPVGDVQAYLCGLCKDGTEGSVRPGFIIYLGKPDEEFRKKVRAATSFALGAYLVDLGNTAFSKDWEVVSFKSRRAYSIDQKVFSVPVLPPAPLGSRWQHEITSASLARIVNAIFDKYEELNFGNLSWAYWHALCATPHIAPVHFGAAIEMLIRRYTAVRPERFPSKIIADSATWKEFSAKIEQVIAELIIPETNKGALRENMGGLNRVHQRDIMNAVLTELGIKLGTDEERAWKRRNDAAHGMELEAGEELALIRDVKLLKIIFHRLLLRITNSSESYLDYASPDFPIRSLNTPIPPTGE